jgi:glycosyltransferase involved in cell wall biosynthesis
MDMAEQPLRVLLLDGELTFRGSSLLTLRIARGLEKRELETALVCTTCEGLDPALLQGVRLHEIPGLDVPVWGRLVARTVYRDIKDQRPDLIHLFDSRLLNTASRLAEKLKRPLLLSVGGHDEAESLVLRNPVPQLKSIISVSESVQSRLPAGPVMDQLEKQVILPGVEVADAPGIDQPLDDDRPPVIGMAGPLEVIKGASFFLRACHRVVAAGHDIRIVIAGSGPEEHSLRQLAASLDLSRRLTFVDGGVSMQGYLAAIDIFCLPSLQQGIGVLMLEAMALGRPVIASGVGGVLSVIQDRENGLIVPPSDSRLLADRIIELLLNRDTARTIAAAGQQLVRSRFREDHMLDQLISLYRLMQPTTPRTDEILPVPGRASSSRDRT